MGNMRVLVGTRKGAFILTSDEKRQGWNISGPHFGGWEIFHLKGSPVDPNRLYALVEAEKSALLVSRDAGESFSAVNEEYNVADRPFYYSELSVDPDNADRVYNIATRLRLSIDGGRTFTKNATIECCAPGNFIHIDNHAF